MKSYQYETRAIFTESLVHETLFYTVVYGSIETHIIMHILENVKFESNEMLEISFFFKFLSSDSYHKMMLELLNTSLSVQWANLLKMHTPSVKGFFKFSYRGCKDFKWNGLVAGA